MARLMHGDYTTAWICALPLEMAATEAMLDQIHEPLPKPTADPNSYILGNLHGHRVVIACLPTGIYGTISAATVVSHLTSTFPRVQYALMVGIGGGVPSSSNDVRLGDMVVSKPTGNYSGIIQYDYGKTVQGGRFEQTGMLNTPPQVILTHMAYLQTNQMIKNREAISTIISDVLEQNPAVKKCDQQQLLDREPCDNMAYYIYYGLIASRDQVMKDSRTRDLLAQQLGILCFEMEVAGLMNQLPTLVI